MNRPLLCFGHRGAMGHAPENTLGGIRKALQLGVDGVEIDVRLCDGQLILLHDERLERTSNGRGPLEGYSFTALRRLDAGGGERIPTLEEACELIDRRCRLNIELKETAAAAPLIELLQCLRESGWDDGQLLVSSFDRASLAWLREQDARVQLGLLVERAETEDLQLARELAAASIHVEYRVLSPEWLDQAHALGLRVYVYTVDDPEILGPLQAMGIDGVFTNYPDRICCLSRTQSER